MSLPLILHTAFIFWFFTLLTATSPIILIEILMLNRSLVILFVLLILQLDIFMFSKIQIKNILIIHVSVSRLGNRSNISSYGRSICIIMTLLGILFHCWFYCSCIFQVLVGGIWGFGACLKALWYLRIYLLLMPRCNIALNFVFSLVVDELALVCWYILLWSFLLSILENNCWIHIVIYFIQT
jgi:hypothetical protein